VERPGGTGPESTPFHRIEAPETLENHSAATLHPLAGFKGQEPVGLFPVFTVSKGPMTAAYSPPPGLRVYNLGPLRLNMGKLKRRKRDRRHRRFIEAAIEWVEQREAPQYWNLRTTLGYEDSRPFHWNDYEVEPRYTYVVDLDASPTSCYSGSAPTSVGNSGRSTTTWTTRSPRAGRGPSARSSR